MKPKEKLYFMSKPKTITLKDIILHCMICKTSMSKINEIKTSFKGLKFKVSTGKMYTVLMATGGYVSISKKSLGDKYNYSRAVAICARRLYHRIKQDEQQEI